MCFEKEVIDLLKKYNISHSVFLPDSGLKKVYSEIIGDSYFKVITVTREEEGLGISSGMYLAGIPNIFFIQSSGIGNCFNAIASLNFAYQIPFLIIANYRGFHNEQIETQKPFGQMLPKLLKSSNLDYHIVTNTSKYIIEEYVQNYLYNQTTGVLLISPEVY